MKKHIYLSSPTMCGKEMQYIQEAFDTNWIAPLGENVDKFEQELANMSGSGYAAALSSGTAAIHLALKGVGVKKNDVVFCSDLTFSATCNPVLYENAVPVFIDSEEDTWNMSPEALEKAFEKYPAPAAVIVVNLYGTPAKLDIILDICKKHHVPLIEDAAESLGAVYREKWTGTFGDAGVYSFNGNKIITSSGGGMLISDNPDLIKKAKFWATQSREKALHYEHREIGYNYRMSNVSAGIGRGQLRALSEHIERKQQIYNIYREELEEQFGITMNPVPEDCKANYWLSCIHLKEESSVSPLDIIRELGEEDIEARPVWKPMHLQPLFQKYDFISMKEKEESISGELYKNGVCLPSDIKNTMEDMDKILGVIKRTFRKQEI